MGDTERMTPLHPEWPDVSSDDRGPDVPQGMLIGPGADMEFLADHYWEGDLGTGVGAWKRRSVRVEATNA